MLHISSLYFVLLRVINRLLPLTPNSAILVTSLKKKTLMMMMMMIDGFKGRIQTNLNIVSQPFILSGVQSASCTTSRPTVSQYLLDHFIVLELQSRSFASAGPSNWNKLPQSLRDLFSIIV